MRSWSLVVAIVALAAGGCGDQRLPTDAQRDDTLRVNFDFVEG
jgi:hypothetical protein